MKRLILFCLASVALSCAEGQVTFVNNGAIVAITPGAQMIVTNDPANPAPGSGSVENIASTTGILRNAGQLIIEGSFVNTSGVADGFGTNTGQYIVQGDWENDATFTADSSIVVLYGPVQAIRGIQNGSPNPTTFYNLTDSNGIKTQEVDAYVSHTLSLVSTEHATADYRLIVLNTDTAAIVQNTVNDAFVSSTNNGRLVRYTAQRSDYIFPTGINETGTPKIREVSITPPNNTSRSYSVRFADYAGTSNTTSTDGYDTSKKTGFIGEVNDDYYHLINANGNTDPADLGIYFDPTADPHWTSIGRWQIPPQGNSPLWEDLQNTVTVAGQPGSPRYKVVRSAWVPDTDTAFALVDSVAIKAAFAFPTAFVADGQGGIPAENLYFGIINQENLVTLQQLSVYNRWGEMVFDSKRDGNQNWYGHFNGKLQPEGNYVYRAVVINNATGKQYPLVTGNVALLW